MCFSNLPVEFDDHGNPYLADDAEPVEYPESDRDDDQDLGHDPEGAYVAILADLPAGARERISATTGSHREPPHQARRSPAGGHES